MQPPFHLSFTVDDLDAARAFYGDLLGCREGRSAPTWVDFDFFGHQISLHLGPVRTPERIGAVEDLKAPMPHFGAVLPMADWEALARRLVDKDFRFEIAPQRRFVGQPGEQGAFFIRDPSGNALEMKGFADLAGLFDGG